MYLTDEKVVVLGAAGAIGSNLVQTLLATGTANHITMYDPFEQGLQGTAEEIWHCGFSDLHLSWTSDIAEALRGAAYIISSGGAPRKEGMTREDLLKSNCEIAQQLGEDLKQHAPDAKFAIIIFNPADITGLTVLVHSGLEPGRVTTLAALDTTRLQSALAQHFGLLPDQVQGCATYGGHGEKMAPFKGRVTVDGVKLTDLLAGTATVGGKGLSQAEWTEIQEQVRGAGANIIKLRGRSSFQSPSQQSVFMLRGFLGQPYDLPCGVYVGSEGEFQHVMMAMPTSFGSHGLECHQPEGDDEDMAELRASYEHVAKLRDQVIEFGILPPVAEWGRLNKHLA